MSDEIKFRNNTVGRADNPFLILDSSLSDQVGGRELDTLRAHATQAMLDATEPGETGWPSRKRKIRFSIEGYEFEARMYRGQIEVSLVRS